MTSLQNLQAEAREKIIANIHEPILDLQNYQFDVEETLKREVDSIVAVVFEAALQEALGKVPEMPERQINHHMTYNEGKIDFRTETIQGIQSLIPKKDI